MARSKLFDNILQVIHVRNTINGTTTVSTEIDLELPRGYVAKIRKIKFQVDNAEEKWAATEIAAFTAALLLDPDDATTTQMPNNEVEHDVLAEHNCGIVSGAANAPESFNMNAEWIYFEDTEDVITARNMRFNSIASTASFDDAFHEVYVYYTLEQVKDTEIMELLDIL